MWVNDIVHTVLPCECLCVSSILVSFHSTLSIRPAQSRSCKETPPTNTKMMLFVTIAISFQNCILLGNVIGCTVSSYEFPVFCVGSLLNSSCYKWFHLVRVVLGGSSSFQIVKSCSKWFQLVLCFSTYEGK